jgi:hypothetical protein
MTESDMLVHGEIFSQLLQSERFREFVNMNFTIQKFVDDETKTIDIQVIENPPEVVMGKITEKAKEANLIQLASPSMAEKIVKQAEKRARKTK